MNIKQTKPISAPQTQKAKPASDTKNEGRTISVTLPTDGFETVGKVAHGAARAVPGLMNVAWNSPKLVFSPILNAYDPATSNRDQVFYERWSNMLGHTAIGLAAGAIIGPTSSINTFGMMALGGLGGVVSGGIRCGIESVVGPKERISYYSSRPYAQFPEIGEAAHLHVERAVCERRSRVSRGRGTWRVRRAVIAAVAARFLSAPASRSVRGCAAHSFSTSSLERTPMLA